MPLWSQLLFACLLSLDGLAVGLAAGMQGSPLRLRVLLPVGMMAGLLFYLGEAGTVSLAAARLLPPGRLPAVLFLLLAVRALRSSPSPQSPPLPRGFLETLALGLALGGDSALAGAGLPPGTPEPFLPFLVGAIQAATLALASSAGRRLKKALPLSAIRYLAAAAFLLLAVLRLWRWD
jgi:putative Mn2+ efflux pump MntP